jgi:hypothetical protein
MVLSIMRVMRSMKFRPVAQRFGSEAKSGYWLSIVPFGRARFNPD